MQRYSRAIIAFAILLSGLSLIPQVGLFAEAVNWQRFVGLYEDTVTVTRARYRPDNQELEVRATSSSGGEATLSVYETSTGALIGVLAYEGGNEHRGEFFWPTNPQVITVRSSLGGEATVLVRTDSDPPVTVTASATPPGGPTSTSVPPTSTSVPPTSTSVPPTVTPGGPPTETPLPPTSTSVPPTGVPPTSTSVPPTSTAVPPTPSATSVPGTETPTPDGLTIYLPVLLKNTD